MKNKSLLILLLLFASSFTAYGQKYIKKFSYITEYKTVNDQSFFVAYDVNYGLELWKTDGTIENTVLVKDINKGAGSSNPSRLISFNNELYFAATDGINGYELWKTDGTEEGTLLVKNIYTSRGISSNPSHFTIFNDELYFFAADDNISGYTDVWKTDGTEDGTVKVYDLSARLSQMTVSNYKLYFVMGYGLLYESDGTPDGIMELSIDELYSMSELRSFNGELYFITHTTYRQLIRFYKLGADGNVILLKEFTQPQYGDIDILNFKLVGNDVYFSIITDFNSGDDTDELWKTDGTFAGTQMIRSFNWDRHMSGSEISNFIEYKSELYFNSGSQNNYELWKSDGTDIGTQKVHDVAVDRAVNFIISNELLYFSSVKKLWSTDGTETNTKKFSDIVIAYRNSEDRFNVGGTDSIVYFEAEYQSEKALYSTELSPNISVRKNYSELDINDLISFESKIDSITKYTIKVNNIGGEKLIFSKIEVKGLDFYINGESPNNSDEENPEGKFRQTLMPEELSEFEVSFFPSNAGLKKGVLIIQSNDNAKPNFTIQLSGYAEDQTSYNSFESVSLDKEIIFFSDTMQINIDNNEVNEDLPINNIVGVLSIPNNAEELNYELISGEGDIDNAFFTIENNQLKTNFVFDFEIRNTYIIRLKATDGDNLIVEGNIIIDILNGSEDEFPEHCSESVFNMAYSLNDVAFIGNQNVVAIGSHGVVIKSYDGGKTWNKINSGSNAYLRSIQFTSAETGYIVGEKIILKTEDAGENWFPLELPDLSYPNFHFVNSDIGFIFGNDGQIFKTVDGGKYWANISYAWVDYNSGFFFNESEGFVCGNSKLIIKTNDGGKTWKNIDLGIDDLRYDTRFTNIFFINNQIGFISGNKGEIIKTVDGGETWELIADLGIDLPNRLRFKDENVGYVIGGFSYPSLYKTIDGGATWNSETFESIGSLTGISFSGDGQQICMVAYGSSFGSTSDDGSAIYYKENDSEWTVASSLRGNYDNYATFFSDELGFIFSEYGARRTTDGGLTWQAITTPENSFIIQIESINDSTYYLLGNNNILKSIDFGQTWNIISESLSFRKLFHVDEQIIYAITYGQGVYKSSDSGITWIKVSSEYIAATDLHFIDELNGFIVGFGGIFKTTDGGVSWINIELESDDSFVFLYSIHFFNENIGLAGTNNGIVYKTEDAGVSWVRINTAMARELRFIDAVSELEWYALGTSGGMSLLYKSIDGGISWEHEYTEGDDINDFHLDMDKIYGVGDRGSFFRISPSNSPGMPSYIEGQQIVSSQTSTHYSIYNSTNDNYLWTVSGGNQIIYHANEATINWTIPGTFLMTATSYNACGTGSSREITIVVEDGLDPFINGDDNVIAFSKNNEYFSHLNSDSRYRWFINGHESYIQDFNAVNIDWGESGAGEIELIETKNNTGARKKANLIVEISMISGADNISSDDHLMIVYPNPVESRLQILLKDSFTYESVKFELSDINGRIYFSETFQRNANTNFEFNLNEIPAGIYFINVQTEKQSFLKKIIKI